MRAASRMVATAASTMLFLQGQGLAGACVASDAFARPYQPTTILVPSAFAPAWLRSSGYIFSQQRSTGGAHGIEFSAVNYSQTAELRALATHLPFLDSATSTTAFTPVMAEDGQLMAYVGDCNDAASAIWEYDRDQDEWRQASAQGEDPAGTRDFSGPGFLGSTISFASTVEPTASQSTALYSYGGMCPNCNSTAATWLTNATYTAAMTRMPHDNASDGSEFTASIVMANGPRSPTAGFTFTRLPSSTIPGPGVVNQEARYLLLGGHSVSVDEFGATINTYLDISTAAIWNLPEESWSWVYIAGSNAIPSRTVTEALPSSTVLTLNPAAIDSRSGHTAVLSQDESELVIMGGWVGDTTKRAEPQLLVVKLDPSYARWEWHVPEAQPAGPGIYGHGAALLPGNVMMVYGGYEIGGGMNSKREETPASSSPQFLNLTTMSWGAKYINPSYRGLDGKDSANPDAPDPPFAPPPIIGNDANTADDERNRHLGLRLGLGIGAAVALLLGTLGCLLYRRRRSRRSRNETVRSLAQDARQFILDEKMSEYTMFGRRNRDRDARRLVGEGLGIPVSPAHQRLRHINRRSYYGYDKEAEDDLVYSDPEAWQRRMQTQIQAPAPRLSPRANHPPSQNAFTGTAAAAIHPIYEDEEDDHTAELPRRPSSMPGNVGPVYITGGGDAGLHPSFSRPFSDPYTIGSGHASAPATVLYRTLPGSYRRESMQSSIEIPRHERDPESDDWASENDVTSSLLSPTRRLPRSSSSTAPAGDPHSHALTVEDSSPATTIRRSLSFKSPRRPASGTGSGGNYTPLVSGAIPPPTRTRVRTENSSQSEASSYDTARSSLGGNRPEKTIPAVASLIRTTNVRCVTPGHGDDDADHDSNIAFDNPGSPSKHKVGPARGWLGSLRRAFSVTESSSGPTNTNTNTDPDPDPEMLSASMDEQVEQSRPLGLTGIAGRALLHRKQGRRAWEESKGRDDNGHASASHVAARQQEIQHDEEDWDVERAAEGRLVQVVFTVPKEKLRVVNPEVCSEQGDVVSQDDPSDRPATLEGNASNARFRPPSPGQAEDVGEDPTRTATQTFTYRGRGAAARPAATTTPLLIGGPSNTPIILRPSTPLSPASECAREFPGRGLVRLGSPALSFVSVGSGSSISRPDSTEIMTAEFVHMERTRPRTRVLEMVEGIESRLHVVGPRRTPSDDPGQSTTPSSSVVGVSDALGGEDEG